MLAPHRTRDAMCCRQGLSVQELYEQLTDEEKYQGVGGALQVKAPNPADQHRISGHVFAQWLSIVYMTFAQACSPSMLHPARFRSA